MKKRRKPAVLAKPADKKVCDILGCADTASAVQRHCKHPRSRRGVESTAEKFQDWVTEEVLPLIRKTGSFNNHVPQMSPEEVQEVVVFYTQHQRQLIEKETDNQC